MIQILEIPHFAACLKNGSLSSTDVWMKRWVNAANEGWQNGLIEL